MKISLNLYRKSHSILKMNNQIDIKSRNLTPQITPLKKKKNVKISLKPITEEIEQDISEMINKKLEVEVRPEKDKGPQIEIGNLSKPK